MARNESLLDVSGLSELNGLFDSLTDPARIESALRTGAAAGITVFKDEVKARTPYRFGYLRDSVSAAFVPEESNAGKVATYETVFIGDAPTQPNGKPGMRNKDVARWLEWGTSGQGRGRMGAKPFITPAFDSVREAAGDKAAEAMGDKIMEGLDNG